MLNISSALESFKREVLKATLHRYDALRDVTIVDYEGVGALPVGYGGGLHF